MTENNKKLVAIVVPLSNRAELTEDEKISLRHLNFYIGAYDKYLVVPKNLKINFSGFGIKRFDNQFFGSLSAHGRLLQSSLFYESFNNYQYILLHHLDALVFSDQLTYWCKKGFDFIGPPWISHNDAPYKGNPLFEGKVGNGGFSLRKIDSFLSVINSSVRFKSFSELTDIYFSSKSRFGKLLNFPKVVFKSFGVRNKAKDDMPRYIQHEEAFWANRATYYYPEFRIPSVEIALGFGFECLPRYCYEKNGFSLPFGCHAWNIHDRDFWEPFLLK